MDQSLNIKVIVGSTRPNRFSEKPAQWIFEELKKRDGVNAELLDLRDFDLPLFDQPMSPSQIKDSNYGNDKVNAWAKKIGEADGFIIVSPEYNHGTSGVLKNALDSVYAEWNNKAVGFVSYGSVGGARAVEQLRLIAIELQLAPVRTAVHIPGSIQFPVMAGQLEWKPTEDESLMRSADTMIGQVLKWAGAMKSIRG